MSPIARALCLVLLLSTACDCGSSPSVRGSTATPEPAAASASDPTAAAPPPVPPPAEPRRIHITAVRPDGTVEEDVDLAAGSIEACVRGADGVCAPMGRRDGAWFPDDWRATIARLASESRDATCPDASGPTVRIEIDGVGRDVVLPPYPEDRDYFPPDGELRECAPRELARTVATYLAWE